tara:strand:+ start:791 stop:1333 length:543 start_codon:yes stop_codon:yes gene_type:complete
MNNYIEHYKNIHLDNAKYGSNNDPGARPSKIVALLKENNCKYVLDYGCGKGVLVEFLNANDITCKGYDPAVERFSNKPIHGSRYDCVTCLDVLEHIPYDCIDSILNDICSYDARYVLFNIALRKASQLLPDGSNAHLIVQDRAWWDKKLKDIFQVHSIETLNHKPRGNWLLAIHKNKSNV